MGEVIGALLIIVAFYIFLREFFSRDADLMFDPWRVKEESYASSAGGGRLREFRGPLYWCKWIIRQW